MEPEQPGWLLIAGVVAGSVGASLIFSFRVGYGERVDLFFQYARGLDADIGLDTFRVMVARSF